MNTPTQLAAPSETAPIERQAPRWPAWARAAITPVAFLFALYLGASPLLPFQRTLQDAPLGLQVTAMVGAHLLVALASVGVLALLVRFLQRCRLRDIGVLWSARSLRLLGLGVAVSLGITLPAGLALQAADLLRLPPGDSSAPSWAHVALAVSMAFLLQGIPEEWFFRGWLMRVLGARPVRAVWISALVFGSIHVLSSGGQQGLGERAIYVAMATAFGLSAGALALAQRSVWSAIGVHAGFHLANLAAAFLGVGQGPWLWAAIAAGHVAIALYVLHTRPLPVTVVLDR